MRVIKKYQTPSSPITTSGNGYIPSAIDLKQLLFSETDKHPQRAKDVLYRIISQGGKEGTKFDRNGLDMLRGLFESLINKEVPQDRYTGSWRWTEDGVEPNPDRDWNLLFAKGNVKNQYQEIPQEEIRGYDSESNLPTYYGNFVPKQQYNVSENILPLLNFLADHNLGAEVINEETGRGHIELPLTKSEYLQALKNGYTVDNVGAFAPRVGRNPQGNLEMQFYDVGDFGNQYGVKYGGNNQAVVSLQGELADKVGQPFILRQYVPFNVISDVNKLTKEEMEDLYDTENALIDIARVNKVMSYDPNKDTYYGWLPEVNKFYK